MVFGRRKDKEGQKIEKGARMVGNPPQEEPHEQGGRIGREEVLEAMEILRKYKSGKANLERRVVENEQWWKMRHWEMIRKSGPDAPTPEPASA